MGQIIFSCSFCKKTFGSKQALGSHTGKCKDNPNAKQVKPSEKWYEAMRNKKPNIEHKIYECEFCKKVWNTTQLGFITHKNKCSQNPEKIENKWTGRKHTEESKKKISESMKKAHAEGRSYIWKHRMTEPSRPEQFLINVLKNELNMECGTDYLREVPYNGFFLDFCWIDKKVVIEMDGEQHQRFQEQIEKDKKKDALLKADGYKELRIPWRECFHNPKDWIAKVKELLK